jgi:hypothetical protein
MSRGYGKIERGALDVLRHHAASATARAAAQGLDTITIAERVYHKGQAELFKLSSKAQESSTPPGTGQAGTRRFGA